MANLLGEEKEKKTTAKADYSRQRKYNDANTIMKAMRLNLATDRDILDYLEGKAFQTEVKRALRLLMKAEVK